MSPSLIQKRFSIGHNPTPPSSANQCSVCTCVIKKQWNHVCQKQKLACPSIPNWLLPCDAHVDQLGSTDPACCFDSGHDNAVAGWLTLSRRVPVGANERGKRCPLHCKRESQHHVSGCETCRNLTGRRPATSAETVIYLLPHTSRTRRRRVLFVQGHGQASRKPKLERQMRLSSRRLRPI